MIELSSQAIDARDVEETAEILYERDVEAFVRGEWPKVAAWEMGCSTFEIKHG